LIASYDLWPGMQRVYSQRKTKVRKKVKKKRINGEAHDVNKQTIYIVPKSTNESSVQYSPEPARGKTSSGALG